MTERSTVPYSGQKRHRLHIQSLGNVTLPIVRVSRNLHIASFVLIDNYALVKKLSGILAREIIKYDPQSLLCIEAKSLPLTYAICDYLNAQNRRRGSKAYVKYIVVRKSRKVYMKSPYSITIKSITTKQNQKLFIDKSDVSKLRKGRFAIVDDVISTGATMNALLNLLRKVHLTPRAIFTVLFEGETSPDTIDYPYKERIHAFGRIPLYVKD